jgi:hypothetical protein
MTTRALLRGGVSQKAKLMKQLTKFEKECVSLSHLRMEESAVHLMNENYNDALNCAAAARYNISLFVSAIRQKQHLKSNCEACNG